MFLFLKLELFISNDFYFGVQIKIFKAGTFLIRFGSTGGLTVDLTTPAGRLEKKNVSVVQVRFHFESLNQIHSYFFAFQN